MTGRLTGHETFAGRLIRRDAFDVLAAASVSWTPAAATVRYSKFLLAAADADALITGFDYSRQMLQRARKALAERSCHPGGRRLDAVAVPRCLFRCHRLRVGARASPRSEAGLTGAGTDPASRKANCYCWPPRIPSRGRCAAACGTAGRTIGRSCVKLLRNVACTGSVTCGFRGCTNGSIWAGSSPKCIEAHFGTQTARADLVGLTPARKMILQARMRQRREPVAAVLRAC